MKNKFAFVAVVFALLNLNSSKSYARTVTVQEAVIIADNQLIKFDKTPEFCLKTVREIKNNALTLAYAFDLKPC